MTQYYGATYTMVEDELEITNVFPVDADWKGYEFGGYCRPTRAEIRRAGYADCVSVFALAAEQEKHPAVRRILDLNAWKINSWKEYASWKRHARLWVAIEWREETNKRAARKFAEVVEY